MRKKSDSPVAEEQGIKAENPERNLRILRDMFFRNGGGEFLEKHLSGVSIPGLYPRELIIALAQPVSVLQSKCIIAQKKNTVKKKYLTVLSLSCMIYKAVRKPWKKLWNRRFYMIFTVSF